MKIRLSNIELYGGTQPRDEINEDVVAEYAEAMQDGDEFPPVIVFDDGAKKWLADGFHRVHASHKVGYIEVDAEVKRGTRRDAILYSVSANAKHGLRRTNADKRKAVKTLLEDEEWSQWSDSEIARQCEVHQTTVSKYRKEIESTYGKHKSAKRKGADGRTIDTSNIGNSKKTETISKEDAIDGNSEMDEVGKEGFVHRNTKIPEDQKELCPCCGQVLPDNLQIQPDRRRENINN